VTGFVNFKSCLENFSPRHNAAIKFSGNVHTSSCFALQVKTANTVSKNWNKIQLATWCSLCPHDLFSHAQLHYTGDEKNRTVRSNNRDQA